MNSEKLTFSFLFIGSVYQEKFGTHFSRNVIELYQKKNFFSRLRLHFLSDLVRNGRYIYNQFSNTKIKFKGLLSFFKFFFFNSNYRTTLNGRNGGIVIR